MPDSVILIGKDGREIDVPTADAPQLLSQGFRVRTDSDTAARLSSEAREDSYGGVADQVAAGVLGVARGATLGLSDVGIAAAGGAEGARNLRDVNQAASITGEVIGGVVGAGKGIGAAGMAAKAGTAVARTAEGAGVAARIGRAAAGGAVEGAITSAGGAVSDLALSDQPVKFERAIGAISSNMLFGGAAGGAIGGAAKGVELGLSKASKALKDGAAARAAAKDAAPVADDLVGLDPKGLRTARDTELASIEATRTVERKTLADELAAYRSESEDAKIWLATKNATDRETRKVGALAFNADKELDRLLSNPKDLAKRPEAALATLRKQEHALEQLEAIGAKSGSAAPMPRFAELGDDFTQTVRAKDFEGVGFRQTAGVGDDAVKMAKARQAIADGQLEPVLVSVSPKGKYFVEDGRHRLRAAIEADAPITIKFAPGTKGLDSTSKRAKEAWEAVGGGGLGHTAREAIGKVPAALEKNRALQARLEAIATKPASARLAAIDDAKDALSAGAPQRGVPEQMLQGAVFSAATGAASMLGPLAPLVGAKAAKFVTEKVFGRLGKAADDAAARTARAVSTFLDVSSKAVKTTPVVATRVLSSVTFAPSQERTRGPSLPRTAVKTPALADVYKKRSEEIRSQTAYAPDGSVVMRPEARAAMASRLAPIAAGDALMADRMETIAARRIEFLASKLPRRPDLGVMQMGPDRWQPSDMEMRTWARYVAAVEDPGGIEERLADGTITPEDAEVMRTVYPERMAAIRNEIIGRLPELRAALPYERRLSLSIFAGVPVDPAMHPEILAILQGGFAAEEGSQGGTQAPMAAPQFGSVRAESGTPSQQRAQGA